MVKARLVTCQDSGFLSEFLRSVQFGARLVCLQGLPEIMGRFLADPEDQPSVFGDVYEARLVGLEGRPGLKTSQTSLMANRHEYTHARMSHACMLACIHTRIMHAFIHVCTPVRLHAALITLIE